MSTIPCAAMWPGIQLISYRSYVSNLIENTTASHTSAPLATPFVAGKTPSAMLDLKRAGIHSEVGHTALCVPPPHIWPTRTCVDGKPLSAIICTKVNAESPLKNTGTQTCPATNLASPYPLPKQDAESIYSSGTAPLLRSHERAVSIVETKTK